MRSSWTAGLVSQQTLIWFSQISNFEADHFGGVHIFKVIVAGTRTFDDYELLKSKLDFFLKNQTDVEIVSGTARGADALGERYAAERGLAVKQFPADWDRYGRSAGYRRNAEMAEYADAAVVFWDGKSKGSKHMIDLAKEKGLPVRVVLYNKT